MLRAIDSGSPINLFADQIRCPIWAVNLADALLELVETGASGLLHVVGPQPVSRFDLGVALLAALGYDPARWVLPASAPDTLPKVLHLSIERAQSLLVRTPLLSIAQARTRWQDTR
jgi:dTDP-4-dehydrorhamnose reductase